MHDLVHRQRSADREPCVDHDERVVIAAGMDSGRPRREHRREKERPEEHELVDLAVL